MNPNPQGSTSSTRVVLLLLVCTLALAAMVQTRAANATGRTAPDATIDVSIGDNFFNPAMVNIAVGDAVRWTNNGAVAHTATSDTGIWNSGNLNSGQQFSFTFNSAGTFPYHCEIHPQMTGSVIVSAAATITPTTDLSPTPSDTPIDTATPSATATDIMTATATITDIATSTDTPVPTDQPTIEPPPFETATPRPTGEDDDDEDEEEDAVAGASGGTGGTSGTAGAVVPSQLPQTGFAPASDRRPLLLVALGLLAASACGFILNRRLAIRRND
jgi:plastocyanin